MDKRKALIAVLVIGLLAAGAWAVGLFGSDPALAELNQIRDEMFDRDLPEAQRDQLRAEFRQRLDSLSESQRRAFFDASRGQWAQRMEQRLDEFFALPPAQQQQRIDEFINRMLERQNERERDRGDRSQADRGRRGNRGGWRNMSEAQRDERAKRRLDRSTPKSRAQRSEFGRMLRERMEARGIDPSNIRDRWRGRW